jgi:FtsZ-binding cell division protein ZapB
MQHSDSAPQAIDGTSAATDAGVRNHDDALTGSILSAGADTSATTATAATATGGSSAEDALTGSTLSATAGTSATAATGGFRFGVSSTGFGSTASDGAPAATTTGFASSASEGSRATKMTGGFSFGNALIGDSNNMQSTGFNFGGISATGGGNKGQLVLSTDSAGEYKLPEITKMSTVGNSLGKLSPTSPIRKQEGQESISEITKTIDESIHKMQETIVQQNNGLQESVTDLNGAVTELKNDFSVMNGKVDHMNENIDHVKNGNSSLKDEFSGLQMKLQCVETRLDGVATTLAKLDDTMNKMSEMIPKYQSKQSKSGSGGGVTPLARSKVKISLPDELRFVFKMGDSSQPLEDIVFSPTPTDYCDEMNMYLNMLVLNVSFSCNKIAGKTNIVPRVLSVADVKSSMDQSSLLIGNFFEAAFDTNCPVLALIREGSEFFTVFGRWDEYMMENSVLIFHSPQSKVSESVEQCARKLCKNYLRKAKDDKEFNISVRTKLFESMPEWCSLNKRLDFANFSGEHTSLPAFSFVASFCCLYLLFRNKLDPEKVSLECIKNLASLLDDFVVELLGVGSTFKLSSSKTKKKLLSIVEYCETTIRSEPFNAIEEHDTHKLCELFKTCYENFSRSSDKRVQAVEVVGKSTSSKRKNVEKQGKTSKRPRATTGGEE